MPAGPLGAAREWLAWSAVWTLALQSPMWIAVGIDSWHERTDPTMGAVPVAGWVPVLGLALAVAVPAALLLSVVGTGPLRPRRSGLLLGGLALMAAAVAWTGFPDGDTGAWYVGLTAVAGLCALAAAASSDRVPAPGEPARTTPGPVVAAVLVLAGGFTAWTCWRGGVYWDWHGSSATAYELGVGLGVAQLLLGLTARWWVARRATVLRWVLGAVAAVAGATAVLVGATYFVDMEVLYRWVEDESAWGLGTPLLIAGVGLLATATAARRDRLDLAGLSLAAATTVGLLALWRETTWGSVMA